MRITCIQNFIQLPPPRRDFSKLINFTSKPDSFEKSPLTNKEKLGNYYDKLQKDMEIVSAQDVENIAHDIQLKTGENLEDIYKVLDILTEYSSYKSLKKIEKELNKEEIKQIKNFTINEKDYKNSQITLTSIFHYFSKNNIELNKKFGKNTAVIIDKNLLNYLEKNPSEINKQYKYIYIENFENGYNFLTQNGKLKNKAIKLIKYAQKCHNNYDLPQNVQNLLNFDNYKKINSLGIDAKIITANSNSTTPEKIANNLNPIIPTKNKFISSFINKEINNELEKTFFNSFEELTEVITPKKYNQYLKDTHTKLLEYLESKNKSLDDVYFIIPSTQKSFILTTYLYQKINNIKHPKNIIPDYTLNESGIDMSKIPDNAVFLLVDDCAITGLSMIRERFYYKQTIKQNKNISIVFAPITSTSKGIENINKTIRQYSRSKKDKVLIPSKNIKTYEEINKSEKLSIPKYSTSLILPYMGPDSNIYELTPLYEKFFNKEIAQKASIFDYDFEDTKLS